MGVFSSPHLVGDFWWHKCELSDVIYGFTLIEFSLPLSQLFEISPPVFTSLPTDKPIFGLFFAAKTEDFIVAARWGLSV
jgi:hypothetical protein